MTRTQVRSSNIASIGYDKDKLILEVEFIGGSTYTYEEVPENIYNSFLNATSKGIYFHNFIKGKFDYSRIS